MTMAEFLSRGQAPNCGDSAALLHRLLKTAAHRYRCHAKNGETSRRFDFPDAFELTRNTRLWSFRSALLKVAPVLQVQPYESLPLISCFTATVLCHSCAHFCLFLSATTPVDMCSREASAPVGQDTTLRVRLVPSKGLLSNTVRPSGIQGCSNVAASTVPY